MTFQILFLIVALVLFAVATFTSTKWNLVAAGLFFATLATLWPSLPH